MNRLLSVLGSCTRNPSQVPRNVVWRFARTSGASRTIFVVGSPPSGTTLVQSVVAAHSRLFSVPGEIGILSHQNIFGGRHFGLPREENRALCDSRDVVDFFDRAVRLLESRNRRSPTIA